MKLKMNSWLCQLVKSIKKEYHHEPCSWDVTQNTICVYCHKNVQKGYATCGECMVERQGSS